MTRMIKYMVFQTICLMIRVWRITKYLCVLEKFTAEIKLLEL